MIDSGSTVWDSITRPCQPMMAFGSGSAYSLGGFESSQTALSTANLDQNLPVPGLMQFNMKTQKFLNSTAGGYSFNGTAEKGAMHYVPSFGPDGLFIVMGGDDCWHTDPEHLTDLETISIYDPSSEQWFNQTTTGNIPQPRKEFCLAGIESNNATYEMYHHFPVSFGGVLTSLQFHVCGLGRPSWSCSDSLRRNLHSHPACLPLDQSLLSTSASSTWCHLQRCWREPNSHNWWLRHKLKTYYRYIGIYEPVRYDSRPVRSGPSNFRYDQFTIRG